MDFAEGKTNSTRFRNIQAEAVIESSESMGATGSGYRLKLCGRTTLTTSLCHSGGTTKVSFLQLLPNLNHQAQIFKKRLRSNWLKQDRGLLSRIAFAILGGGPPGWLHGRSR